MAIKGIVIDPGHGGDDSGVIGDGIYEKNYTLKISKYMYDMFSNLGIPVTMTRTTDETLSPAERVDRVLKAYGPSKDVLVISNHLNIDGGGTEVIYALRNDDKLSKSILNEIEKTGHNVRNIYQRKATIFPTNDYYFMQKNTSNTEAITVEYDFLNTIKEDLAQAKKKWEVLAEATVQGILKYIGYTGNVSQETDVYTVKAGDTLYGVANKYGVTVDYLKKINNLNNNILTIGQVLKVKYHNEENPIGTDLYIVKTGDSLYSIAREYNISVNDLMNSNNLTSTLLQIGQILKIHNKNDIDNNTYKVQSGDTLYSVAKKYNIPIDKLKELNNLSNNLLSVGQILIISK